ncbi:UNVERIFIED_CONTAM: cytochrome [Sesamum radiatum]|uniref:Cytochrome n=1 Tax=Sesamum radiatum TaxID=300843 RepID=A0AAW2MW25_SESRA
MSSACSFLFIPSTGYSSTVLSFELLLCFLLFVAVFAFWLRPGGLAWALSKAQTRPGAAIPGPSGFPLLGLALSFTSSLTHRLLSRLSESFKAESLMAFSVGFTRFIISSNPETAKEILNSSAFADRPVKESAYGLLFHRAMGFAPYGEYWRNLRRISATHLFSPKRIASFGDFRREIGVKMVEEIMLKMEKNCEVEGVRRRSKKLVAKVNAFVGKIIEEKRLKRAENGRLEVAGDQHSHDFVDVLLDLENENRLSDSDMIAVLWEMIFRGTDTVAILLEWILARMILHPEIQAKAQAEIDSVIGTNNRPVADSDLPNLCYLQAIVKESLRMHPPGPLPLWARLAIHDTCVGPHFVPAGTTAMVNMLAPFGSGRRVCPGKAMGLATVQLWLAQLLHNFEWTASHNHAVDLSECLKLSMEMKQPLVCKAFPRTTSTNQERVSDFGGFGC